MKAKIQVGTIRTNLEALSVHASKNGNGKGVKRWAYATSGQTMDEIASQAVYFTRVLGWRVESRMICVYAPDSSFPSGKWEPLPVSAKEEKVIIQALHNLMASCHASA